LVAELISHGLLTCVSASLLIYYRKIDDTIQIQLNKAKNDPGRCKTIGDLIQDSHSTRTQAIRRCIDYYVPKLESLQQSLKDKNGESRDRSLIKLGITKAELGFLHSELEVEKILEKSTSNVFRRKCSSYHHSNM